MKAGPEDIKIKEFLSRIKAGNIREIILANNPNIEGEYRMYISSLNHRHKNNKNCVQYTRGVIRIY